MKILLVLEYYIPHIGGVETVFQELSERYVKLGNEVHIVTMRLPGTKEFEKINGVNIHRISIPRFSSRYWFDFLFSIPKIYALAKKSDIIHASDYITGFPVWIVAKIQKKPCIVTITEPIGELLHSMLGEPYFKAKVIQNIEKFLIGLPYDKYACISYYTQNCVRLIGVREEKIKTIYLGIDVNRFNSTTPRKSIREKYNCQGKFVYLSFGRPGITKGIEYLIKAVPIISKKIPDSVLLLILSNDPHDRYEMLRKMILENKIGDIILIDPVPRAELPDYIASSDCVVVPSLTEGFGFTAAEACAMDKPVVATNVGSLPEVVSGKYILVEPRDPEEIADAIFRVWKGDFMTTPKKDFKWDSCVNEYLKLYNSLVLH